MQHAMRRKDRELTEPDIERILQENAYGVLSTVGAAGEAYGVPLSYWYKERRLYFHSAVEGRKLENLQQGHRVSFCVVGPTQVLPDKFSTEYESVVLEGGCGELTGEAKEAALLGLVQKYSPAFLEKGRNYIEAAKARVRVFCITADTITGKARR